MDGTRQAINQPPHSTGQKYPGLRAHINADAIPSPVAVAAQDQAVWDNDEYYTLGSSEQPLPMSSSRYVAVDQGVRSRSLEHAARPLARYRCAACGFEAQGYFWQCPGCQAWESFPPKRIEEL